MSIWETIVIVLLIVYLKWIFFIFFLPFAWADGHRGNNMLGKWVASPYLLMEKMTRGGFSRWMIMDAGRIPSVSVRRSFYRFLGASIGRHVVIHYGAEIRCPKRLAVGEGTVVGDNAILDARCGLLIGRHVNISSHVSVYTLQHDYRDRKFRCNEEKRKMRVEIGDRVWLGANVIVLPGVTIGEGAVCCSGAVVTKDVPPFSVVAGIPAKSVSDRPQDIDYVFKGKTCWFY